MLWRLDIVEGFFVDEAGTPDEVVAAEEAVAGGGEGFLHGEILKAGVGAGPQDVAAEHFLFEQREEAAANATASVRVAYGEAVDYRVTFAGRCHYVVQVGVFRVIGHNGGVGADCIAVVKYKTAARGDFLCELAFGRVTVVPLPESQGALRGTCLRHNMHDGGNVGE